MSAHDYTPEQALETLLLRVRGRDASLADRIQTAIDAGKDINETEKARGRRKPRIYRRKVAYTHEEALKLAVDVLQAHFIELPLFINSAIDDFEKAAIGIPPKGFFASWGGAELIDTMNEGDPKNIEIELRTETRISPSDKETQSLERVPANQIDEELSHLQHLRKLVDF